MLNSVGCLNLIDGPQNALKSLAPNEKRLVAIRCDEPFGFQVGATGFEPATSWSRTKRSSQAELRPGAIFCTDVRKTGRPILNVYRLPFVCTVTDYVKCSF